MKHKVEYQFDIVSKSQVVKGDGCNSIWFQNIALAPGNDDAVLDRTAPLRAGDPPVKLENTDPEAEIDQSFHIKFNGDGDDKRILVTRIYKRLPK